MPEVAQGDVALLLTEAVFILLTDGDVGVVVVDRDVEIVGKVFQTIALARRAADVQQQTRHDTLALVALNDAVELLLIIYLVHKLSRYLVSSSALSATKGAPASSSSFLPRKPHDTPAIFTPALRAVRTSTSLSPMYTQSSGAMP